MKPFKLGLCMEDCPYDQADPRYDYFEFQASLGAIPFNSDADWQKHKEKCLATGKDFWSTNDYIRHFGLTLCGPDHDAEQCHYWAKRLFPRLAQVGTKYIGVYGTYFPWQEGWDFAKTYDQAIASCNVMADFAEQYGMSIALEPCANLNSLWPKYLDAVRFAKETGRRSIRVMADLNYFVFLPQPLEDILKDPEYLVQAHIQGNNAPGREHWVGQPNVGDRGPLIYRFFEILKEIDYKLGVTVACNWVSTKGDWNAEVDWPYETGKTYDYLMDMVARIYK